jgi:hypothetical protein
MAQIDVIKKYWQWGFIVPPLMLVGGLIFFIPREPFYYGIYPNLNWFNLLLTAIVWIGGAWITFYIALKLTTKMPPITERIKLHPPFQGIKGVIIFFIVAGFIFGYFEVQFQGFYLRNMWELLLYPLVLIPYFSLCYTSRKYLCSWQIYVGLWIFWGIIWDTAIPGFVNVPNLFTWHQWMFAPVVARIITERLI